MLRYYTQVDFILALFDVVLKHILVKTTYPPNADTSVIPDKSLIEAEKEMLTQFQGVLRKFIQDRHDLQLIAVYALQVLQCNFESLFAIQHLGNFNLFLLRCSATR